MAVFVLIDEPRQDRQCEVGHKPSDLESEDDTAAMLSNVAARRDIVGVQNDLIGSENAFTEALHDLGTV
jgi:hypothetical protein